MEEGDPAPGVEEPPQPAAGEQQSEDGGASAAQAPPSSANKAKRGQRGLLREIMSLGQAELPISGGRPSRRAATAAQAAVAHTIAFERSKGNQMSPPKPPGALGLAHRLLQAGEGPEGVAAAAAAASPAPSTSQSRRSKRAAASSPAVHASGASSAGGGGGGVGDSTPSASVRNGIPGSSAEDASDWEADFQSPAARKRRTTSKQAKGKSKSRAAAGPSAPPPEQADAPVEAAASGATAAADRAQPAPDAGKPADLAATEASGVLPDDSIAAAELAVEAAATASAAAAAAASAGEVVAGVELAPLERATPEAPLAGPNAEPPAPAAASVAVGQGLAPASAATAAAAEKSAAPSTSAAAGAAGAEPSGATSGATLAPPSQFTAPPSLSHYPQEVLRLAAVARAALGLQRGQQANLRMVMKTGLLAGLEVRFQNKAGKVLNKGVMNAQGMISCGCPRCHGKSSSCSEFEEHAGSRDRRPADGIFFEAHNVSMRDLVALVNNPELSGGVDVHMEVCYGCKEGGDLLCCDGCTAAFHLGCAGLQAVPEGQWFCRLCMAEGRDIKRPPPLQLKPAKPSGRSRTHQSSKANNHDSGSEDVAASKPKKSEGGAASPTGRVHMAAPSIAFRRPAGGNRRGRNSNKHKRLFEGGEGSLPNGEKVAYITTQGERLLEGEVVISATGPSGILCYCCNQVVSCSQFEAHAGRGSRRAPYDNIFTSAGVTLKAIAAMLPDLEEDQPPGGGEFDLANIVDGCREVINELDTVAGGCVLCHQVDFQRGGFGPRTVLFCDQCEREFHVGCLKAADKCDLQAVPEGDWFCSQECTGINQLLGTYIQAGQMEIPDSPLHTWQLLRGKDGTPGTTWSLKAAQELLQESFDPIMDLSTNTDLLPLMLYARQYGEWDYKNVHVMLLRHKGKPVVAAIMRVFGPQLAELPLIATKLSARRQGHARVLLKVFDELLAKAGVHRLCLPAAHETVLTWRQGFSFVDMPEEDVKLAKQQLRILVFPGTEMLWKEVQGVAAPEGHHILVAPPEQPKAEGGTEGAGGPAEGATAPGGAAPEGAPAPEAGPAAGNAAALPAPAGVPAWPGMPAQGALPGPILQSTVLSTGGMAALPQAAPGAAGPPLQWQPNPGGGWAMQQAQQQQAQQAVLAQQQPLLQPHRAQPPAMQPAPPQQQQQQQQVWGGRPIGMPGQTPALPQSAYRTSSLPGYSSQGYGGLAPPGPGGYGPLPGAQQLAGFGAPGGGPPRPLAPTRSAPPAPPSDPFLDTYDDMFAAAMAAADAAAEEQLQPARPPLRLPSPPPMVQPSQSLFSPPMLPANPMPAFGPSPTLLQPQPAAQPAPLGMFQQPGQQLLGGGLWEQQPPNSAAQPAVATAAHGVALTPWEGAPGQPTEAMPALQPAAQLQPSPAGSPGFVAAVLASTPPEEPAAPVAPSDPLPSNPSEAAPAPPPLPVAASPAAGAEAPPAAGAPSEPLANGSCQAAPEPANGVAHLAADCLATNGGAGGSPGDAGGPAEDEPAAKKARLV